MNKLKKFSMFATSFMFEVSIVQPGLSKGAITEDIILCPDNNDKDNSTHNLLISNDFEWSRFEEPSDGMKRKYWKTL